MSDASNKSRKPPGEREAPESIWQAASHNPQSIGVVAIVGASARAAAFSVLRSGRKAVAADLFADADLAQLCQATRISPYPEGLADWLAATECDGWFYTGALENHPDLVDRLAAVRPLLGNAGDVLRRCRDPLELQKVLRQSGLYFPETRASRGGLPLDGSWLSKSSRGSSGSGVQLLADQDSQQRTEADGAFFQQRIEGRPASAVFALSEAWATTLGMTAQWVGTEATGAGSFQYAGSQQFQHEIQPAIREQIETLSHVLAKRFRLRGLVGVDLVLEAERAWIVEVNPRYTASVELLERINGVSAIEAHLGACLGAEPGSAGRGKLPAGKHGKAILRAKQDVTIDINFFSWAMAQSGCDLESGLADIPRAGSKIPRGRPLLTVFASAAATPSDHALRQRIAEVEARLYGSNSERSTKAREKRDSREFAGGPPI